MMANGADFGQMGVGIGRRAGEAGKWPQIGAVEFLGRYGGLAAASTSLSIVSGGNIAASRAMLDRLGQRVPLSH